ncbi:hypothetical protein GXW82_23580 [Streptacidiphilus sp. 4-A2]|nr:hypothetical protein [Streptacidiphilus sp. 4-A2]
MSPAERAVNWAELCGWVVWLYDRYELSVESRLPECWAEHPGMIEELWALMTWRKEIYNSEQPAGQAARYWHTELRAVTANAAAYYASQCRTGHKGATGCAANSPDLQQQWLKADPLLGIPQSLPAAPAEGEQLAQLDTMTGSAMQAALANGEAKRLSPAILNMPYSMGVGGWTEGRTVGFSSPTTRSPQGSTPPRRRWRRRQRPLNAGEPPATCSGTPPLTTSLDRGPDHEQPQHLPAS